MIEIKEKNKCSGCGACIAICPQNAIHYYQDDEGVRYPKIDIGRCIQCGRCDKVCPMKDEKHGVPSECIDYKKIFYAAQLKEKKELDEVSSGGAFWALAQMAIDKKGVVYGARQTDVDNIEHFRTESLQEAKNFRKSKYLQSDSSKVYQLVREDLEEGKYVLYSGTGCQVAGLNMYLKKCYANLLTCEVVCHGVPCGLAWQSYRIEKESKKGKKIVDLIFRDKSKGWNANQYKIVYEDGTVEYERSTEQLFHKGYLMGLFYRPSCGCCVFASMPRVADITLADYWKYDGTLFSKDNKGVSLVVVNSRKGYEAVKQAEKYMKVELASETEVFNSCRHLYKTPIENPKREEFMNLLQKNGYHKAIAKYIEKRNILIKCIREIRSFLYTLNKQRD